MKGNGWKGESVKRGKVKTARVRTQGPLKKTAKERTQAPLKVEALRKKDSEFEEREWKRSERRVKRKRGRR